MIDSLFPQAGARAVNWVVLCDFDGTISREDVTDSLLQRFGQPGWQELEAAWQRAEIGSRECMRAQVALLDMSREELLAHLDTIEVDSHFPAFVDAARAMGVGVQIVSDGIDTAIRHVLGRHGLARMAVSANRLVQAGPRSWRLESPFASAACARASGNCKCERLAQQRLTNLRVLYVGDSTSDFCVSGKADFVLAKDRLVDYCEDNGIAHARFSHFGEALGQLAALVSTHCEVGTA